MTPIQPLELASAFLARLAHDPAVLAHVTSPIGVAGIAGKEPEVIAVAVLRNYFKLLARTEWQASCL